MVLSARLLRFINNVRLRNKLLFSYVFVVMLPVLLVGGTVIYHLREQALESAIAQTVNNVNKLKNQTDNLLRVPLDISNRLMFDKVFAGIVNKRYSGMLELTTAYNDFHEFQTYRDQYREIENIRFYSFNPTLVNNTEFIPVQSSQMHESWFQSAMQGTSVHWLYVRDSVNNPISGLSLVRQIPFPEYRSRGVLVVGINRNELNNMLSIEPFNTMIIDQQGIIVASKDPAMVGTKVSRHTVGAELPELKKGIYKAELQGQSSHIIVDELIPRGSKNGLTFISIFSNESIVREANRVILLGTICVVTVLLAGLLLVMLISFLITRRLHLLSSELHDVAGGNLTVVSRVEGKDEIGDLSRKFNTMVASIQQLMVEVYETSEQNARLELAQRDIKLKMLASQINPHFLFNTLESLRMKAHMKGEKEIAHVIKLLGTLMRRKLEIGSGYTTIQEELDMVRSYLDIQHFRYGDRLRPEVLCEPGIESVRIPPLLIQPLVENAVIHGLENMEDAVTVQVSATLEEANRLVKVEVKDNGSGMSQERLRQLEQHLQRLEEDNSGIGMRNVHHRLRLMYGEAYGLQVQAREGEGTIVRFLIPVEEDE
ncbi:cache domain-containing sensor histidine kinase [Paenibacillus massiliensis]|uniref:cache domain-containing sensor histidine kinase n=1 Tax=Paenibacillus massiliensis TaxID=225917 RepID=UPI00036615AF|nr:sensor histidine kinase [Paenibacillus massiliensis]